MYDIIQWSYEWKLLLLFSIKTLDNYCQCNQGISTIYVFVTKPVSPFVKLYAIVQFCYRHTHYSFYILKMFILIPGEQYTRNDTCIFMVVIQILWYKWLKLNEANFLPVAYFDVTDLVTVTRLCIL